MAYVVDIVHEISKNAGYNEPVAYRVCLNENHHHLWSVLCDTTDTSTVIRLEKLSFITYHWKAR